VTIEAPNRAGCEVYAPSRAIPPARSHRQGQIPGTKRVVWHILGLTDDWEGVLSATVAPNRGGVGSNGDFQPISRYISEMVQDRDIVTMEC